MNFLPWSRKLVLSPTGGEPGRGDRTCFHISHPQEIRNGVQQVYHPGNRGSGDCHWIDWTFVLHCCSPVQGQGVLWDWDAAFRLCHPSIQWEQFWMAQTDDVVLLFSHHHHHQCPVLVFLSPTGARVSVPKIILNAVSPTSQKNGYYSCDEMEKENAKQW